MWHPPFHWPGNHPWRFLWLSFLIPSGILEAQITAGDLRFRTVDSLGYPISGVNVTLTGPSVQGTRVCSSDSTGFCTLLHLPPGATSVQLSHASYQPVLIEHVLIQIGKTRNLGDIALKSRTHDLPEMVISGRQPLIDPLSTSSGINLRSLDFEDLPLERNYKTIATIIPHANASYFGDEVNIGGATGFENRYIVDGADLTDPHFQTTGTTLPYNFVKEIQIITGGYEAEYQSSLGGLINVVTPSGGNELHGSAFGFYTGNTLTASGLRGPMDLTQGPYVDHDIGVGLGGPLVRDRLWFYAAYNLISKRLDVLIPGISVYEDKTTTQAFGAKLSWRASERLNIVLTSTGDPTRRQAVGEVDNHASLLLNPDPYLSNIKTGGVNVSLNGTYLAGDNILIDGALTRITRDELTEPATERGRSEIPFWDGPTNTFSGGSFLTWSSYRTSTAAKATVTFMTSDHRMKGGVGYKEDRADIYLKCAYLQRESNADFLLHKNGDQSVVRNRLPSLFLQDSWRISSGLTLNVGLRWDGQYLIGSDGNVHQKILGQVQPRLGFLVLPDDGVSQKLYGSFGRYYEDLATVVTEACCSDKMYFFQVNYKQDPRVTGVIGDTANYLPLGTVQPEVKGLQGQYYDEFTLGYERRIGTSIKMNVEGVYRTLREAVAGVLWDGKAQIGNPGRLNLTGFPRAQRDYTALALTLEQREAGPFSFIASYVLSRNYGNYPGLYNVYFPSNGPNTSLGFFDAAGLRLATGLLPNDRTHVFKFSGSYRFDSGLSVGASILWQSGTPWSDLAGYDWFLAPRGAMGKTPAIWDLNARLSYELPLVEPMRTRLIFDLFHIASQRKPVDIVQQRYLQALPDGTPTGSNPLFGVPSQYQPPMSARLGMEMSF